MTFLQRITDFWCFILTRPHPVVPRHSPVLPGIHGGVVAPRVGHRLAFHGLVEFEHVALDEIHDTIADGIT